MEVFITDRIIVAFDKQGLQFRINNMLEDRGIQAAGCFATGADVIRTARKLGTAVVICGFRLRDMTANDLAAKLESIANLMVLVNPNRMNDLCSADNLCKVPTPVSRSDFFESLYWIKWQEETKLRPLVIHKTELDMQIINRAKKMLIDYKQLSEREAHRFLQKQSMKTGLCMVEIAKNIVDFVAC